MVIPIHSEPLGIVLFLQLKLVWRKVEKDPERGVLLELVEKRNVETSN